MKSPRNSGRLVAELRKIIGKSQSQFAAMIGVSKHTIISAENGRNQLSRNLAERIEIATGAQLFHGTLESPFNTQDYTPDDFRRWREKYNPTNPDAALKQFEEMNPRLKVILLAAAKSGLAGNRDRLPAVCLSFRQWLNEARQHFKLQDEIEDILEDESRAVRRVAFPIQYLLENPANATEDLAEHDIDFNMIKKHLMKHPSRALLIVEDELREIWSSSGKSFPLVCRKRKLIPRAKCWIKTLPPIPTPPPDLHTADQMMKFSQEQLIQVQTLIDEQESQDLLAMPSKITRKRS
jgi:DNA-binding XRE family transcriptional regulator